MKRVLKAKLYGKMRELEIELGYYEYNRTLYIGLYEEGENFDSLTCNLPDTAPGRNCAYINVNHLGEGILKELEKCGFGKRTNRICRSGFVSYPEFQFDEEVLREFMNEQYMQYLAWQDALKDDEQYLSVSCKICEDIRHFIVKKSEAQRYQEYRDGARYLIQDIFPNMSPEERGLFAQGQNMCGKCFRRMFG